MPIQKVSEKRAMAFRQLLLDIEAKEGYPVSINYRDACYMLSVSKHITGYDLFIVDNTRSTPWETFSRDLRKDIESGVQIFGHYHYSGDFWLLDRASTKQPPKYKLPLEFHDDRDRYLRGLSVKNDNRSPLDPSVVIQEEEDELVFPEGAELYRLHRSYERNPLLIKIAKERRKISDPGLHCEICKFSFVKAYGDIGEGFIEAHHTRPLSELNRGGETAIEDIAMVCSNCHRMLHRFRPWLPIADLMSKMGR